MTGEDLKRIRQSICMTQMEMGFAIGMARETIGDMERGVAPIEKRTELAVYFVTENYIKDKMRSILGIQYDCC